jgi:hypothetical protein
VLPEVTIELVARSMGKHINKKLSFQSVILSLNLLESQSLAVGTSFQQLFRLIVVVFWVTTYEALVTDFCICGTTPSYPSRTSLEDQFGFCDTSSCSFSATRWRPHHHTQDHLQAQARQFHERDHHYQLRSQAQSVASPQQQVHHTYAKHRSLQRSSPPACAHHH